MATQLEAMLAEGLVRLQGGVVRHPGRTLLLAFALAAAALAGAALQLGVNSETDDLFDRDLPFRRHRAVVDAALPARNDSLLVVVDGPSRIVAGDAAADLAARLDAEPDLFASTFTPGAGPFFERHGLLYLDADELAEMADDLAAAQPFLAEIALDPSLRGLFTQLTRAVEQGTVQRGGFDLYRVLESVTRAVAEVERLESSPRSFGELILGGEDGPVRRYVVVEPRPDYTDFVPGRASVTRLLEILEERGLTGEGSVRARVTGDLALKTEELGLVKTQAASAGVVSFVLVALILWSAQRSGRLIAATLLALVLGLIWTAGFAALAIGHLNVISVAFAVLFIGLGVDFGIHLTLRYQELLAGGTDREDALAGASRSVGSSLVLCAITTAIGFYSFVPTGFIGVAELGVISGTGMLISLAGTLTVVPAVLSLGRTGRRKAVRSSGLRLPGFPTRYPRRVCGAALLLAIASLWLVPELHFDANPLRVRDPNATSVQTFFELLDGGDLNPWSIDVLAPDLAAADALAARLEALPSVDRTSTLSRYVPEDQEEKLPILEDIALFLGLEDFVAKPPPSLAEEEAALLDFRRVLVKLEREGDSQDGRRVAVELGAALDAFSADLDGAAVETLRASLVQSVLDRIARLERALSTEGLTLSDLPPVLERRMIARDGRALVEVYPKQSLNDDAAVDAFVREVRSVAPEATGPAVYMFEASETILRALRQALLTAIVAIALLLIAIWRNLRDPLLVLTPLLLAALLTSTLAVLAGIPINFANVIVVPLLLGIGVDSGIHLVHRFRDGAPGDAILDTSTSRAIFWSALTTIASFGALGLASHRGLATLGQLLTLGVTVTLLCNLVFLPALLTLTTRGDRGPSA